jgi:hypothetical protein
LNPRRSWSWYNSEYVTFCQYFIVIL